MSTTGNLVNPLKALRLQLEMSPEQFANHANLNLSAIGQAEEGFYPNPLPSYLLAMGIRPGTVDEARITQEYHQYQISKRESNFNRLTKNPRFSVNENPLYTWRTQSGLAVYGFCSAFCIHMPSVNNFEKNLVSIKHLLPDYLEVPLTQAGYDEDGLLDEFKEACELFKAHQVNKVRLLNNLPLVKAS